jgi:hypothetical protein
MLYVATIDVHVLNKHLSAHMAWQQQSGAGLSTNTVQ